MRRFALTALVIGSFGCGASPPKGPAHTPSGTKEAPTACPKERKQAHEAREEVLGRTDARFRASAARAVMAHGDCELRALQAAADGQGSQDEVLAYLRGLRERTQDVARLFQETRRYGQAEWTVKAFVGEATAVLAFRDRVSAISHPEGLDVQERAAFVAEMSETLKALDVQATQLLRQAVSASVDSGEAGESRALACKTLKSLSPTPSSGCYESRTE